MDKQLTNEQHIFLKAIIADSEFQYYIHMNNDDIEWLIEILHRDFYGSEEVVFLNDVRDRWLRYRHSFKGGNLTYVI